MISPTLQLNYFVDETPTLIEAIYLLIIQTFTDANENFEKTDIGIKQ